MIRLFAALLGFLVAGWIGAVVGFLVGGYFSRGLAENLRQGYQAHAHSSEVFFEVTFQLLGHMAKSDGRISEDEIDQAERFMARMSIEGEHRERAIAMFKQGADPGFALDEVLRGFAMAARFRPDLKRNLITFLVEMAMADDELHDSEETILRHVAHAIGIDPASFEQMLDMLRAQHYFAGEDAAARGDDLDAAYRALGVTPAASDKEVKRAYRKLISEYHPDKMIAKGVPEDMVAMATEKAKEIQCAYDLVEKSRR